METRQSLQKVPAKRQRDDDEHGDQLSDVFFARRQTRINQQQEAEQMRAWVSQEDDFVLRQANKAAIIRVKEGRAKPIDWLSVTLQLVEPHPQDDEDKLEDLDTMNPEGVFDGLEEAQLLELDKNIKAYIELERVRKHREFWETMQVICKNSYEKLRGPGPTERAVNSVSSDIDQLLSTKSHKQLINLEAQIRQKLDSNEPIDVDYWEQLLHSLIVWKARAQLKSIYATLNASRLTLLKKQQLEEAHVAREKLELILRRNQQSREEPLAATGSSLLDHSKSSLFDPEPLLKLHSDDKLLEQVGEQEFLRTLTVERRKTLGLGYMPLQQRAVDRGTDSTNAKFPGSLSSNRVSTAVNEDFSQATKALYEREVARGVNEDEEIFAGEEDLTNDNQPKWADKHRPRKPRYFNRVQMGYEWNKYNQTHYDHDNPPPKVVQGYKFNIFYPDLIDKTKSPTYRIEREHGRKKGQSFAPAGEEDTCLIKFISGAPYEDIAFRIVDKEWDYSAKRERGFKSSFDKGILQLHFQFKKIYYRK
ncbi:MAG: hypothetical protein M1814_004881 [Vezdaea aestivalis]|nr:MAG: hypothetical protein M1814_004881 [Vezdaea aestivalis]